MALFCYFSVLLVVFLLRYQTVAAQQGDQSAMAALQQELEVPGWDSSNTDYCSWTGILCNSNRSVERLELSRGDLRGNVSLFSELKYLKWIDLSFNNFHGSIPPVLGLLTELEFLDLSVNKFESLIPSQFGNLRNLRSFNLSNNLLTGSIPPEISLLKGLQFLNLNQNSLTGEIPQELQDLKLLQELQISGNNLTGSIPYWLSNLTRLKVFTAYENGLSNKIPENLGSLTDLHVLNLHSNQLEGPIPRSIFTSGKLEVLILTMNRLNGNLPESMGSCRGLSNFRIGNNRFIGNIPVSIGNISSLTYFEADNNLLSGEIVAEFAQCSSLTLLNLASNRFTGTVPIKLGNLTNLQVLIISGNSLIGEIPTSIFRCKNLSKLDLSNNRFNGSVPKDLCSMSRLQFLILDRNSIRGEIPPQIGNCRRLLDLQLGNNYLTGNIPPEIGRIKNLQIALNLSFNHLRGSVPRELGKLDKLVSLDLSNNQLSGTIPSEIRGMLSLIEVNFSNNLLTGQVPIFGPFQKSPSSSFSGNKGLCGEPLSSSCGESFDPPLEQTHHRVSYKLVLAVFGSGLTVCLMVTVVVILFMMREKQEMAMAMAMAAAAASKDGTPTPSTVITGNVLVENLKQAIDFNSVVRATLKDSNKLSSGTFSTIYKAVMPSGLILSAKRLKSMDRTVIHHQNKMIRELERLGKLCHSNLTRLVGYVIYEDVVLLLHHYYPDGTLAKLLHDQTQSEFTPDWPRRLAVAIGVAEGLAFLHHVAIIHLDISSGNIFLNANFNPLVGEIEISKLLDPSRGTASISAIAGSFGYIPPEYAYTMQVTAPGNVYSYGVVLLEILTTLLPVDEAFGEGIDLVKWVHSASARKETPEQILDARLSTVSFAWRKQMLGVLKVALLCTDTNPAKRPKMKNVVEMLQVVKQD